MNEARRFPVEWVVPDDMDILFSNNLLVTEVDGQFLLTFCRAVPPLILEGQDAPEGSAKVFARAVARLIIPPNQMKTMIDVLQRRYESFLSRSRTAADEG